MIDTRVSLKLFGIIFDLNGLSARSEWILESMRLRQGVADNLGTRPVGPNYCRRDA